MASSYYWTALISLCASSRMVLDSASASSSDEADGHGAFNSNTILAAAMKDKRKQTIQMILSSHLSHTSHAGHDLNPIRTPLGRSSITNTDPNTDTNTNTNANANTADMRTHKGITTRTLFGTENACFVGQPLSNFRFQDPLHILYYSQSVKDFSSYFTVSEVESDYTDLLELLKAPCEYYGGTLYSISGSQTCVGDGDGDGDGDSTNDGKTFTDTNLPYCAFQGCTIDDETVTNSDMLNICDESNNNDNNNNSDSVKEYKVEMISSIENNVLSEECRAKLKSFPPQVPAPPLKYEFNMDDYTIVEIGGTQFDFTPYKLRTKEPCEAEGGYLYKVSYSVTGNEFDYFDETGVTVLNYPICFGDSINDNCDVDAFFEKLFVPASKFDFEGRFRHKDFRFFENKEDNDGDGESDGDSMMYMYAPGNETYPAEQYYQFLGYEAVSVVTSTVTSTVNPNNNDKKKKGTMTTTKTAEEKTSSSGSRTTTVHFPIATYAYVCFLSTTFIIMSAL